MNEGYRRITTANERDRQESFVSTARRVGITEQSVEKDFWVCWTIDALFHGRRENAPRLLFKGGTSLSKAFGVIRRFSEDIDITVFRHDLGEPVSIEDLEKLSAKKRNAKLDEIRAACREELRPELETLLFQAVGDNRDERYSVTLDDTDLADELPDLDLEVSDVITIQATRTFWDKVVIVHGLRGWFDNRGELRQEGQRISRHYYDLHVMRGTVTETTAVADLQLGAECVRHARMFFNRPPFNLAAATPGSFALTPMDNMRDALRRDYEAMAGMIIGQAPAFDDVIASIASLEKRLNEDAEAV